MSRHSALTINIYQLTDFYFHYITFSSLFSSYPSKALPFLLTPFCQGQYLPFVTVLGKTCWKQEGEWTTLIPLATTRLLQVCTWGETSGPLGIRSLARGLGTWQKPNFKSRIFFSSIQSNNLSPQNITWHIIGINKYSMTE